MKITEKEFKTLMPKVNVYAADIDEQLEEQNQLIDMAEGFTRRLSIVRHEPETITFDMEQLLNYFHYLKGLGLTIEENPLARNEATPDEIIEHLLHTYPIQSVDELSAHHIQNLLEDEVMADETNHLLFDLVFTKPGIGMGDELTIPLAFTLQKALLAAELAKENIERLINVEEDPVEIYAILPTLQ